MDEYVCNFEVAVHGVDFVESFEAVDDLFEEGGGFVLSEAFLLLQVLLEVSSVAVLHGYKLSPLGTEGVDIADYVLIVALLEHSDLGPDQFLKLRSLLHEDLWDGFDGHGGVGLLVEGFVDDGPSAFTQHLDEVEGFHPLPLHVFVLHFVTHL